MAMEHAVFLAAGKSPVCLGGVAIVAEYSARIIASQKITGVQ
jgi:hypothetical protein